jgi:hypothetical protein
MSFAAAAAADNVMPAAHNSARLNPMSLMYILLAAEDD